METFLNSHILKGLLYFTNSAINYDVGQCWIFDNRIYFSWFKQTHIWYKGLGIYKAVGRAGEGTKMSS